MCIETKDELQCGECQCTECEYYTLINTSVIRPDSAFNTLTNWCTKHQFETCIWASCNDARLKADISRAK